MPSSPINPLVLFDGEWEHNEADLIRTTAQEIAEIVPPRYQNAPAWTCYCCRRTKRCLYIATFNNLRVDTFVAPSVSALADKMRCLIDRQSSD